MPTVSGVQSRDVIITWSYPSYDGGSLITHYIIEQKLVSSFGMSSPAQSDTNWMLSVGNVSNSLMSRVTSLTPYTGYQFRVVAVNVAGSGTPSLPSMAIVTLEAGRCVKFYTPVC